MEMSTQHEYVALRVPGSRVVRVLVAGLRAIGAGRVSDKSPCGGILRLRRVPVPEQRGIPAGAHEYQVIAEESLLQILVYRGGAWRGSATTT